MFGGGAQRKKHVSLLAAPLSRQDASLRTGGELEIPENVVDALNLQS